MCLGISHTPGRKVNGVLMGAQIRLCSSTSPPFRRDAGGGGGCCFFLMLELNRNPTLKHAVLGCWFSL